ncbi:MAG TPA: acyltransferase family protein [Novosphingobium sp.]|nr:acyltransferase family protein [Novosphingobium sp.]
MKFAPLSEPLSFWLDFVRGSAAVLVLLDHSRGQLFGSYGPSFSGADHALTKVFFVLFGMGTQAVMCFFVMSGLLIAPRFLSGKELNGRLLKDYSIARLSRIWVVAIPALIISAAAANLSMAVFGASTSAFGTHCAPGATDIAANLLFLNKAYFPTICSNGPYWSIHNEMFYYIMWPALMFGIAAESRKLRYGCTALLALMVSSLLVFDEPGLHNTLLLFPVWIAGGLCLALPEPRGPLWLWGALAALAVVAPNMLRLEGAWLIEAYVIAISFALFFRKASSSTFVPPAPAVAFFRWLANISFSLYLTHVILVNLTRTFLQFGLKADVPFRSFSALSLGVYAGLLLAAMCLAQVFYLLFERHSHHVRRLAMTLVDRPGANRKRALANE